jgi:hypothetical protein
LVPVDVAPPQWLRTMMGLNRISFGPDVEPLPNGQVFWAGTGGLYAHLITLGEGEAAEMTLGAQNFSPVVAWLDGADGTLQDARKRPGARAWESVAHSVRVRPSPPSPTTAATRPTPAAFRCSDRTTTMMVPVAIGGAVGVDWARGTSTDT